jgi:hypothetical protein
MEEPKTIAPDELLMEQLNNRNWDELWLRLMGRCFWLMRKRFRSKMDNEELKTFSRNIIGEVIGKIFIEKTRNWNTEKYSEFEDFIVGVIDSHISNSLKKKSKELKIVDDQFLLGFNGDLEPNAQDIVITKELKSEIYKELESAGASDDELLVFDCLTEGIEKPEDIRNDLGMSESDFHNTWRRLKRKRKVIQVKLEANGY